MARIGLRNIVNIEEARLGELFLFNGDIKYKSESGKIKSFNGRVRIDDNDVLLNDRNGVTVSLNKAESFTVLQGFTTSSHFITSEPEKFSVSILVDSYLRRFSELNYSKSKYALDINNVSTYTDYRGYYTNRNNDGTSKLNIAPGSTKFKTGARYIDFLGNMSTYFESNYSTVVESLSNYSPEKSTVYSSSLTNGTIRITLSSFNAQQLLPVSNDFISVDVFPQPYLYSVVEKNKLSGGNIYEVIIKLSSAFINGSSNRILSVPMLIKSDDNIYFYPYTHTIKY